VTDILFDDPCLLFALSREAQFLRRQFPAQEWFPGAPCRAQFCGPAWLSVLVVEMGIGPQRTEKALTWLLNRPLMGNVPYRPKVVIAAGYSGALCEGLQIGDIVLATEVVDADGHCWPTTWPPEPLTGEWQPPLHRGRLLSMPQLVSPPDDKRTLGDRYQAVSVDMETAVVARLCRQHEVPFACVRAISDAVDTALSPQLVALLEGERIAPVRVLEALVKQPGLAGELWRLARHTRHASRQLARALGELLTLTLPWAAE
jgi:adenosylhomocysteine nucleosidase